MTDQSDNTESHTRATRRGQQLFQIALRMATGPDQSGEGAHEALIYLATAIPFAASLSDDPQRAIAVVLGLLRKIDAPWYATAKQSLRLTTIPTLFADAALEVALGHEPSASADVGTAATAALAILTDAIVRVAALNSNPRQVIEHVVHRLDETDVVAVRKEMTE